MRNIPADTGVMTTSAPLGKQFPVHRALLITAKAVRKRVAQTFQAEMIRATAISAIQERTMWILVHDAIPFAALLT